ncbi:MAG: hypothetical protein Fur0044_04450 [Anaerolineae bacterium]|nr:hypothetical protein [Anaerolineales bacterium]MCQ3980071.1 hypothetical protein [Anaerolineae bacterium]
MIGIGVIGWGIVATAVIVAFVAKENGGRFGKTLSDQAIFAAVIGAFYSLAHGLVGATWGAIVGVMVGMIVAGGDDLTMITLSGAIIGSYFGPIFVAFMLLRYYTAVEPASVTDALVESEPAQSSQILDYHFQGEVRLQPEASRAKSWRIAEI